MHESIPLIPTSHPPLSLYISLPNLACSRDTESFMATATLAAAPLRASLLQLPSHLRVAAYRQSLASHIVKPHTSTQTLRSFSASATRRNAFTETLLTPCNLVLDALHLALPWYAAIPMTAVLVRTLIVYPFSLKPARSRAIKHVYLIPIATAKSNVRMLQAQMLERLDKYKHTPFYMQIREFTRFWEYNKAIHQVGKTLGAPRFSWTTPLNLVTLFAFTEAIRLKCGFGTGLFSILTKPLSNIATYLDPKRFPSSPPPPPPEPSSQQRLAELMAERMEAVRNLEAAQGQATSNAADLANQPFPPAIDPAMSAAADPTLHTEGLSWFVDLTLPDPTLTLPILVGLSISLNVIFRAAFRKPNISQMKNEEPIEFTERSDSGKTKQQKAISKDATPNLPPLSASRPPLSLFERLTLTWALLFGMWSTYLPSAFLLYFISARVMGFLQSRYMEVKLPMPKPLKACRRPVRHRLRRSI